jgi:hypothetical protein
MKYAIRFTTLCLLVLVSVGAIASSRLLLNIPLQWKPTSPLSNGAVTATSAKVSVMSFKDTRQNPQQIAENREDSTPKPVTTTDDVGAFVTTHMKEILNRNGVTTVDSGADAVLSGEVTQFFVTETNTYEGQIALHVTVSSPSGKVLWQGTTSGTNSRFGRSYKAENYYETFSDTLIDATTSLLRNSDFMKALSGHT